MPIRITHVLSLSFCLACVTGLIMAALLKRTPTTVEDEGPWIPLPASGMDASDYNVRLILARMFAADLAPDPFLSLAGTCGSGQSDDVAERYELLIGDYVLEPDAHARWITFVVAGNRVHVTIRDWHALPPPPPLPGDTRELHAVSPVTVLRLDRQDLAAVRAAWRDPRLWDAPPAGTGCRDGRPLAMQACVHGRYAVRSRNCGSAEAGETLWQAVQSALPAPTPMRYELR